MGLARLNLTTGSYNIDIGSVGAAGEANTIRIGTPGTQTATYIAGINGSSVMGVDVVVGPTGRLGVVASSARYKKDIQDMGATSDRLMKLRPVTFRYKTDEHGTRQYGLIAEEVEHVYPELIAYDIDGKVETVRYSMLTSMLLNEVQKQNRGERQLVGQVEELSAQLTEAKVQVAAANAKIERQDRELATLKGSLAQRLAVLERALNARDRTLASK